MKPRERAKLPHITFPSEVSHSVCLLRRHEYVFSFIYYLFINSFIHSYKVLLDEECWRGAFVSWVLFWKLKCMGESRLVFYDIVLQERIRTHPQGESLAIILDLDDEMKHNCGHMVCKNSVDRWADNLWLIRSYSYSVVLMLIWW